jgi:putative transposase
MPRRARQAPGGVVYHVLNRAAGRRRLFDDGGDYEAFLRTLGEALARPRLSPRCCTPDDVPDGPAAGPVRLLCFCLMPNHWHLVVWPRGDGDLSAVMFWLTMTHAQRWRHCRHTVGEGPLYQGRFKCFPVQAEGPWDGGRYFRTVCRYGERNPLRAGLVGRAEDWPYSSLHARLNAGSAAARLVRLDAWPVEQPADAAGWRAWADRVNEPQTAAEEAAVRECARRGRPFGDDGWQRRAAADLGLEHTLRPPGRPRKRRHDGSGSSGSRDGGD